jgi:hypothetical protein
MEYLSTCDGGRWKAKGYTLDGRPIHAVVAMDPEAEILWLITVYGPSLEHWEEDFRTRRTNNEMPPV